MALCGADSDGIYLSRSSWCDGKSKSNPVDASLMTQGASYRPAETLIRTGGRSVKVARHRFFETFQHLMQVTKSLESMQPGGEGFKATVRVRLLHAALSDRIMKLVRQRPSYYDVEKYGVPINNLDNIQALCTFSTSIL